MSLGREILYYFSIFYFLFSFPDKEIHSFSALFLVRLSHTFFFIKGRAQVERVSSLSQESSFIFVAPTPIDIIIIIIIILFLYFKNILKN